MQLKVGIPLMGDANWHGGVSYLEGIIHSFGHLDKKFSPDLFLLVDELTVENISLFDSIYEKITAIIYISYVSSIPLNLKNNIIKVNSFIDAAKLIDIIFPINTDCLPGFNYGCWLPDLQHRNLPELFSKEDFFFREKRINFMLDSSAVVMVNSQDVKNDIKKYYPNYHGAVEVIPVYSYLKNAYEVINTENIVKKYQLPDSFLICCNQFWQHKNHDTLFRALALTKSPIHLVCTGSTSDYRNREWFNELERLCSDLGVKDRVTFLGFIPREDQIQLIRHAIGIVQPSIFEGWSLVMEEARALGKIVIASDLAIHREKNIPDMLFFNKHSPEMLAQLMELVFVKSHAGVSLMGEKAARIQNLENINKSASHLLSFVSEQAKKYQKDNLDLETYKANLTLRYLTSELHQVNTISTLRGNILIKNNELINLLKNDLDSKNKNLQEMLNNSFANKVSIRLARFKDLCSRLKKIFFH